MFSNPQHPIEPGFFQIVCVQLGKTPKTGSGVLLKLTFNGLEAGSSPLTLINPKLANKDSVYIPCVPINGTLTITYTSTIKPTTLSGRFELQGRTDRGGIPVTLSVGQYVGQGPYTVPPTNVSGNNLYFPNVAMDLYTVSTAQARYPEHITPAMGKQIALLANGNILPPLKLLGGNAIWTNNEIDIFDVALVSGEIGKTTFIADADINNDGKVDILDLALVAGNYGLTSAVAYADW
jgi:hypothetical protein